MSCLVRTFRGYDKTADFLGAKRVAKALISEIVNDGFATELWWAVIECKDDKRCYFVNTLDGKAFNVSWLCDL